MKKHTIMLAFTGLLAAVLLAGCGSSSDNNSDATPAPTEETTDAEQTTGEEETTDVEETTDAEQTTGAEQEGSVDLVLKAKNFAFDQEVYEVPAGSTVNLSIENIEGYHGFLVKGLDIEVTPGKPVTFVAEPGEYEIVCSIQCGVGHNDMKSTLVVN